MPILAHSPIEGIANFHNGLLHPVFLLAHLLLLIAWGLFWGQQGAKEGRSALFAYSIASVVGLVAASFGMAGEMEPFLLGVAAVLGLLVASNRTLGPILCSLIAALVGLSLGLDSNQETLSGMEKFVAMLGSGIALNLLPLFPWALADSLKKEGWRPIVIRVIGSWIAAIALLALALAFAPATR